MTNPNQIKFGYITSPASKGDRITVYFADGTNQRLTAQNDLVSSQVSVIGDRVFSDDVSRLISNRTTELFKTRSEENKTTIVYPYLSFFLYQFQPILFSTYNGKQTKIGKLNINTHVPNRNGNVTIVFEFNFHRIDATVFEGTILSQDRTTIISFNNEGITEVVRLPMHPEFRKIYYNYAGENVNYPINPILVRRLVVNRIFDDYFSNNLTNAMKIYGFILKPNIVPNIPEYIFLLLPMLQVLGSRDYYGNPTIKAVNYFSGTTLGVETPNYALNIEDGLGYYGNFHNHRFFSRCYPEASVSFDNFFASGDSYDFTEEKTVTSQGADPSSFSTANLNWSYALLGEVVARYQGYFAEAGTYSFGGTLAEQANKQKSGQSDINVEIPIIFNADGSIDASMTVKHQSNTVHSYNYNSSFLVSGEAVTVMQKYNAGMFFDVYRYRPVTRTSIAFSGSAEMNLQLEHDNFYELTYPVPVSDRATAYWRYYVKHDLQYNKSAIASFPESPVTNNPKYPGNQTDSNSTGNLTSFLEYKEIEIESVFAIANLGIYIERSLSYTIEHNQQYNSVDDECSATLGRTVDAPDDPSHQATYNIINLSNFYFQPSNYVTEFRGWTRKKEYIKNKEYFKIALFDEEHTVSYPGLTSISARLTNVAEEAILAYIEQPTENTNITIRVAVNREIEYIKSENQLFQQSNEEGSTYQNVTSENYFERVPLSSDLDINDLRYPNLIGELCVYKFVSTTGETYLILVEVNSENISYSNIYEGTDSGVSRQHIDKYNCTILTIKKVKPFSHYKDDDNYTKSNYFFTVRGTSIFRYLRPERTNLFTRPQSNKPDRVFIASTMFPVSKKDTQTMIFEYKDNTFHFLALVGGVISNIDDSPSRGQDYNPYNNTYTRQTTFADLNTQWFDTNTTFDNFW